MARDHVHRRLGVDVTRHHDDHPLRPVPGTIERQKLVARGGLDHVLEADRLPFGVARAREQERQHRLGRSLAGAVTRTLLAQDHAAFGVDLGGRQGQSAGDLAQDTKALVEQPLVIAGQIELVDGVGEAGAGVGVRAEGEAGALQELDQLARRQVLRALERHVLEEMGEPALLLGLHQRARLDHQAEADPIGGRATGSNGIAQPVGQPSPHHGGIVHQQPVGRHRPGCR